MEQLLQADPYFQVDTNRFQTVDYSRALVPMLAFRTGSGLNSVGDTPAHWHQEIEINLFEQGKDIYQVNGREYPVQAGQAIFVKPNALHATANQSRVICRVFLINLSLLGGREDGVMADFTDWLEGGPDVVLVDDTQPWHLEFIDALNKLYEEYEKKEEGYVFACRSELYRMLMLLRRGVSSNPQQEERAVSPGTIGYLRTMMSYVQVHYPEKIYVEDIASSANISRSFCDKAFRNVLHCSPVEYLGYVRQQKAVEMLSAGCSVTETAMACGFGNLAYFSRQFKKQTGVSPARFRK